MYILLFISVFCSISSYVNSYLAIFYGGVGSSMNCTKYSTVSWDTCMTNCESNANCYLAYTSPTISCYICGYGGFKGITYSSSETDYIFAMKTWSSNCSYNQDMLSSQNIDVLKTCPGGYGTVTRSIYTVCAQRLYYNIYKTKAFAVNLCIERTFGYGGKLMGLNTDIDRINGAAAPASSNVYAYNCSLWIGLELQNSIWTWTDPYMSGAGSIVWASGHPKTGYTCASLQYGTALLQSENCAAAKCTAKYCPGSCLCVFPMQ
ncbi:unnamed protein product [Caenorhabditis angaria]|uniref:PAN-3 domain-containing protein n=1 Tax=Caenorhabditis angaria TaxID=860376 RepID=A0A9P1IU25_9PELO|nr:unnamed protein product [Caenorhabditis angaria]